MDLGSSCPRPAVTTVWKNVAIDMDLDAALIKKPQAPSNKLDKTSQIIYDEDI